MRMAMTSIIVYDGRISDQEHNVAPYDLSLPGTLPTWAVE